MSFFKRLFTSSRPSHQAAEIAIAPGRGYTFEIVGEAKFQPALDRACGGKTERGHKREVIAELFLEDSNPHDSNAVAVQLGGQTVGYIPRAEALIMRQELQRLGVLDPRIRCRGRIFGGWDRGDGDTGHYGIRLSISKPLRLQA